MSEVLYKIFQKVFTTEFDSKKPHRQNRQNEKWKIRMNRGAKENDEGLGCVKSNRTGWNIRKHLERV